MADPLDALISKYSSGSADPLDELIARRSAGQVQPKILPVSDQQDAAIAGTTEGGRLAEELQTKVDNDLLAKRDLGQGYAAVSSFGNTMFANAPRAIVSRLTGVPYDEIKAIDAAAARQYPVTSGFGTVGGALGQVAALPEGAAATMLGRAGQSALAGGLLSGSAEFIDTGDENAANRAALGGAVLGGVAAPAVEGLARAGSAALRGPMNMARGFFKPEEEAARRVSEAIQTDARAGNLRMQPGEFQQARMDGQPVAIADVGGETTKALARSAANTSPEGRAALQDVTQRRFEGQGQRISEFVRSFGPGFSGVETRDALKAAARRENRPAYEKAYAQGESGVWHEGLSQLASAPDVAEAIKGATRTGANKAAAEGFRPVKNPFSVDENGMVALKTRPDGSKEFPSLAFWDVVKQNLDDKILRYERAGEKGAANDARTLKNQLLTYLDDAAPAYKDARAGAAKFFGAEDAFNAGEIFATGAAKGKNAEYAKAISAMKPSEKQLFQDGFISKLSDQIAEVGDRRNVINTIFSSPAAKERLVMAVGPGRAKALEANLHIERVMDELRTAVSGNSTTVRQLTEAGLAGGVAGGFLGGNDPKDISLGALMGAAARTGKLKIDSRVAQRVGEMLASDNPEVIKKAAAMAAKNRPVLEFLKNFEVKLAGTGAAKASETYTGE
jgi:hypothetical protein